MAMTPAALAKAIEAAEAAALPHAVELIRPFLADIGWFQAMLAGALRAMADDPRHLPGFRASRQGDARHLVLVRTERIWLTATVVEGGQTTAERVHFSGRVSLCRPLYGCLRGERWRREQGRATTAGVQEYGVGDLIELDERHEAISLLPTGGMAMILRAQIAPPGPVLAHVHDAGDGRVVARAQADEGHARALMLLSLLRVQGRQEAADQFAQALDAPLPGQRWAVMREYLALDTRGALPALRRMAAQEKDAAVRALAAGTLAQVEAMPCRA